MTPRVERLDPPYLQIVAQIRQQILDGKLQDGDTIPSARQISKDWGVALATATKVLSALRADGLVEGVPGKGTVVRLKDSAWYTPKDRFSSVERTGRIYAPGEYAKIVSSEVVKASDSISDALGVRAGTRVIRRHRVAFNADDNPVSASVSWFAGTLAKQAPKLLEAERMPQGTAAYIADMTGRRAVNGRDQLAARGATKQDAKDLGVKVGSPVLVGHNWLYDTNGDVIEYGEFVRIPDRWSSYDYRIS